MKYKHALRFLLAIAILTTVSLAARAENIDPDNDNSQYAWGENIGWINLEPGGDGGPGMQIYDFEVHGWMWGENIGWISLSCANRSTCDQVTYEVSHDGLGNLGGLAWGENIGWVRFSHPYGNVWIDPANGELHGYAWAENVGWIQMGSTSGPFPYSVRTAWRCSPPPPLPSGNLNLEIAKLAGDAIELGWNAVPDASGYDVVYGNLNVLRDPPGGDFVASTWGCVIDNEQITSTVHAEPAPLDINFWYLVRPVNCGGSGSYDSAGLNQLAPRDVGIEGSGVNCRVP
jgi:hypothetical protein